MMLPPVVVVRLDFTPGHRYADRFDDRYDDSRADRHALSPLAALPNGTRVRVHVGGRTMLGYDAVRILHDLEPRLQIQIEGESDASQRWHVAVLTGDPLAGL